MRTRLLLTAILFTVMVTEPILSAYSSTLTLTILTSKSSYIVTEDVNVYGSLAYDGSPVQGWPVALEVKDPYGTTVVTRTSQTDANGEYNRIFRLPLQAKTGTYTVYVSSSYKGTPATNTTTFELMPRDITVTDCALSKNVTGQGYSMNITVTCENLGFPTETFSLTVYANASAIAARTVTLTSGNSTILTFAWNTFGFAYGKYTISAHVEPVPGETNTTNNLYIGDWVVVTIPGDVDGNFAVNILDVVKITTLYMYRPYDPGFDPNKDIDGNGVINILDVVICTSHYGQKWP